MKMGSENAEKITIEGKFTYAVLEEMWKRIASLNVRQVQVSKQT